ncbi:MAG: HEAT repeat domain-containing protein [Nitrospirae bacterium]|nr:HEAT repeat domain-containing protein [Nitrospirota bacterium]
MLVFNKLKALIKGLSHPDVSKRRVSATKLGEGDERAIYPLVKALSDSSPAVQDAATASLIQIGGEVTAYMAIPILRKGAAQRNAALVILKEIGDPVVPLLYDLLNDNDDDMKKFALDLMGDIASGVSVEKVMPMLKDPNPNVRAAACRTLGLLNAHEAAPLLQEALNDDEWVAFAALEALGSMGSEEAVKSIHDVCDRDSQVLTMAAIETLGKIHSPRSKKALISCLQSSDELMKPVAIKSLINLGVEPDMCFMAQGLIDMLDSEDWEDKLAAMTGLKGLKEQKAVAKLIDLAGSLDQSSPDDEERYNAINDVLSDISQCRTLVDLIRDEGFKFRGKAILVELLGRLRCTDAIEDLMNLLRGSYRDIRRGVAKALVEIADDRCIDLLIDALGDDDCHVKLQVVYALRKLGTPKAYEPIFGMLMREECNDVIEESVKALLNIDGERFVKDMDGYPAMIREFIAKYAYDERLVLRLSHDEDPSVKISAVMRLSSFNTDETEARLEVLLSDSDHELRKVAVMGFFHSGTFSRVLLTALNDRDMWVRFYAVQAIASTTGDTYLAELIAALEDKEVPVVMVAMEALCVIGGSEVYDAINNLLQHEDESVRVKAEEVLQSL